VNSGDMEVQKKKKKRAPLVTGRKFSCAPLVIVCASSYWKEVQLRAFSYCVVTQFAKKEAPRCFFSPCVVNVVNNGAHAQ